MVVTDGRLCFCPYIGQGVEGDAEGHVLEHVACPWLDGSKHELVHAGLVMCVLVHEQLNKVPLQGAHSVGHEGSMG